MFLLALVSFVGMVHGDVFEVCANNLHIPVGSHIAYIPACTSLVGSFTYWYRLIAMPHGFQFSLFSSKRDCERRSSAIVSMPLLNNTCSEMFPAGAPRRLGIKYIGGSSPQPPPSRTPTPTTLPPGTLPHRKVYVCGGTNYTRNNEVDLVGDDTCQRFDRGGFSYRYDLTSNNLRTYTYRQDCLNSGASPLKSVTLFDRCQVVANESGAQGEHGVLVLSTEKPYVCIPSQCTDVEADPCRELGAAQCGGVRGGRCAFDYGAGLCRNACWSSPSVDACHALGFCTTDVSNTCALSWEDTL